MKTVFRIIVVLLIAVIAAMILVPFVFKDDILNKIKEEASQNIDGELDFSDVNISLFKSFPHITIGIEDVLLKTPRDLSAGPLASIKELSLTADLGSVINKDRPIEVTQITLVKPSLILHVPRGSKPNYELFPESEGTDDSSFVLKLDEYKVVDGYVRMVDSSSDYDLLMEGVEHTGSGELSATEFVLHTKTDSDRLRFTQDATTWLKDVRFKQDGDIRVNMTDNNYAFEEMQIALNDLAIWTSGDMSLDDENIAMELAFNSKETEFKKLLSILPNAYSKDFNNVRADGSFSLDGTAKGFLNTTSSVIPLLDINLNVKDGSFKFPDKPLSVDNIQSEMHVHNDVAKLDGIVVDIPVYHFECNDQKIDGKLHLSQLISNPKFDVSSKGKIVIEDIIKAYPTSLEIGSSGIVELDIAASGLASQIENQEYESLTFDGLVDLSQFNVKLKDSPSIVIEDLKTQLSPKLIEVPAYSVVAGRSDFTGKASITNPLGLFLETKPVSGSFSMKSDLFDANEWISEETSTKRDTSIGDQIYQLKNFKTDFNLKELRYMDYVFSENQLTGTLDADSYTISSYTSRMKDSDFDIKGELTNLSGYVNQNEVLKGEVTLNSEILNLNQFMTTSESADSLEEVLLIPEMFDIDIDFKGEKVQYTNLTLTDVSGNLDIDPSEVALRDMAADCLNGKIRMSGLYNTFDVTKPGFEFKYDIGKMHFAKAVAAISTIEYIAPIAKYIDGIFNSTLILKGNLTKDLIPELATLTGSGYIETLEGKVTGFEPLKQLSDKLNLKSVRDWTIRNSKNWFAIDNGKVKVEDFDYKWNDINFYVGGNHRMNNEIDYVLESEIPRQLLDKNQVGSAVNSRVDQIFGEFEKAGINVEGGDTLFMDIFLTGTITSPKIDLKPTGISGKSIKEQAQDVAKDKVDQVADSIKTKVENTTDAVREKLEAETEGIKDTVVAVVEKKTTEILNQGKAQLDSLVKSKLDTLIGGEAKDSIVVAVSDKVKDVLGKEASVDSIKSKIDKWNPFKKKKKKGN